MWEFWQLSNITAPQSWIVANILCTWLQTPVARGPWGQSKWMRVHSLRWGFPAQENVYAATHCYISDAGLKPVHLCFNKMQCAESHPFHYKRITFRQRIPSSVQRGDKCPLTICLSRTNKQHMHFYKPLSWNPKQSSLRYSVNWQRQMEEETKICFFGF